jgi:hypothetical protein
MEVSGQLHALVALPMGEQPPVPIVEDAGWVPEPVWMLWSREKSRPSQEPTPAFHPVVRRYTDWTLLAPLVSVKSSDWSVWDRITREIH